jgi:hypothetical protein
MEGGVNAALLDSRCVASLPFRCALVLIALAVVAWLALSIRALDLDAQGRAIVDRVRSGKISAAELERGRAAFQGARRFNADRTPLIHEAFLLMIVGRRREALALTEHIVADEPDNRDGWTFVYLAAQAAGDRATEARAVRAVRALDPQNAPVILRRRIGGD